MSAKLTKVMTLIMLIGCFSIMSLTVNAAGPRDGEIVDGSLLTSNQTATNEFQIAARGAILASGMSSITHQGLGTIYISGKTYAFQECNSISATIYLERLEGDAWVYVTQRAYSGADVYLASGGVLLTLQRHCYYRLRGTHRAQRGNISESGLTLTDGIYIE